MFVNFSNHPSSLWGKEQLEASREFGEIVDVPFPLIDASLDEDEITIMAAKYLERIMASGPDCVMCQGEFTLAYQVIRGLREKGVKVVAACSERKSEEKRLEDGTTQRLTVFKFVKYRFYM